MLTPTDESGATLLPEVMATVHPAHAGYHVPKYSLDYVWALSEAL